MPGREQRKLAAILAADVVGYSRLMEADERDTFERVKSMLENVIAPSVDQHGGRIVKMTGDGLLADFASAVEAVECAVDVQRSLANSEKAETPEHRMQLRIGINIGDIILTDDDIFGDGVNIAARLEGIAPPGGICVSDQVASHIAGKLDIEVVDGGECQLKNIRRPVRVWHWAPDDVADAPVVDSKNGRWRPTVAVLPFDNMSGDLDQEYFADGLTEDLITSLTYWRRFPVVARNSTFTYKGKAVSITQAARELGANYIVEGSVRKAGNRVRVTAQLIDGATNHHVWAERYDRHLDDMFDLQDELVHCIGAVIAPEISRAELRRSSTKRPNNLSAWDHYLRGEALLAKFALEDSLEAREHFEKAIALDPEYGEAYAGLTDSYTRQSMQQPDGDHVALLQKAVEFGQQATKLDPNLARSHFALSTAYILCNDHDLALAEAHLAVRLNPNDPVGLHALGNKSDLAGDAEGITRMELAQQLNPRDPGLYRHQTFLARAYVNAQDYEAAIAKSHDAVNAHPEFADAYCILAVALAHAGRFDEAAAALERCEQLSPGLVERRRKWRPYTDEPRNMHLKDGLEKAIAAMEAGLEHGRLDEGS